MIHSYLVAVKKSAWSEACSDSSSKGVTNGDGAAGSGDGEFEKAGDLVINIVSILISSE